MMFREGVATHDSEGRRIVERPSSAPEIGEAYRFMNTQPTTTKVYFDVSAGLAVQMEVVNSDPANVHCRVERISEFHGFASVLQTFDDIGGHVDCGVSCAPDPDTEPYLLYGWRVYTTVDGNESKFIICCNHTGAEYLGIGRGDRQGLPAPWGSNHPESAALGHPRIPRSRHRPSSPQLSDRAWFEEFELARRIFELELAVPSAVQHTEAARSGFGDGAVDTWAATALRDANRWTMPVRDARRYTHDYSGTYDF